MSTEEDGYTIVYNDEIYNAAEVRRDLEAHGHRFPLRCETEAVLRECTVGFGSGRSPIGSLSIFL